jgi:hypothetical protein
VAFQWYEIVVGPDLEQGDLLNDCLAPLPPARDAATASTPEESDEFDVVVLTQSCDLQNNKTRFVMVCPIWPLDDFLRNFDKGQHKGWKDALSKGRVAAYHLLNRCGLDGHAFNHLVVSFGDAFSIPVAYAKALAGTDRPRVRLQPPYREHLAQSFARYYMRIGLPVDIDPIP